jgi:hypothetical protein
VENISKQNIIHFLNTFATKPLMIVDLILVTISIMKILIIQFQGVQKPLKFVLKKCNKYGLFVSQLKHVRKE